MTFGLLQGTSPREFQFEVKVLISHLLGEVTEVFCLKLIKSPEPLTFVTASKLGLSDSYHRNCLNPSLHLRETLTIARFSSRHSAIPSEEMPRGYGTVTKLRSGGLGGLSECPVSGCQCLQAASVVSGQSPHDPGSESHPVSHVPAKRK